MNLKPQDLLFVLNLVNLGEKRWSFNKLSIDLGMSPSEVHWAAKRAVFTPLAIREDDTVRPNIRNLEEFLLHGVQYIFIPERGEISCGLPTGSAPESLRSHFDGVPELPPVWPDPEGGVRGESFSPVYRSVPVAAKNDPELYASLVLVDAVRGARGRERDIAIKELKKRLTAATGKMDTAMTSDQDRLVIAGAIDMSRAALRELAHRYHIRRLVLFGSAVRGELRPESDIDLLIEFESGEAPSLGGMVEIQDAFISLFGGRKVDIATPSILKNPYRRRAIEKDMEELYAA